VDERGSLQGGIEVLTPARLTPSGTHREANVRSRHVSIQFLRLCSADDRCGERMLRVLLHCCGYGQEFLILDAVGRDHIDHIGLSPFGA